MTSRGLGAGLGGFGGWRQPRGTGGDTDGHRATSSPSRPLGPRHLHPGTRMASARERWAGAIPGGTGQREAGGRAALALAPLGRGTRARDTRLGGRPRSCHLPGGARHSWSTAGSGEPPRKPVPPGAAVVTPLRGPESPVCPPTGSLSQRQPQALAGCTHGCLLAPGWPGSPPTTPRCPPGWGQPASPRPCRCPVPAAGTWHGRGEAGRIQAVAFPRPRWPRVKAFPRRSRQSHPSPTCPHHRAGTGRGPQRPPAQSRYPLGVSGEGTCHRPRTQVATGSPWTPKGGGTPG